MDSISPAMNAFEELEAINNAFSTLHSLPTSKNTLGYDNGYSEKLKCTIHAVGFSALADGIIDLNRRAANCNDTFATDGSLKQALHRHILLPKDRFSASSRNMRRFLKTICNSASEVGICKLENAWREVLSDTIFDKCTRTDRRAPCRSDGNATKFDFQTPPRGNKILNDKRNINGQSRSDNPEARSEEIVDYLIASLREFRDISKIDLAVTDRCCMSTDLAFIAAFKRLPKERALEVTKALVVRISSLVDSYKAHSMSRAWAQSLQAITDLIQVWLCFYMCI